jgi:signal transduction histidine kinase
VDPVANLARVPARPPLVDVTIAAALSLWALLEVAFLDGPGSPAVRVVAGLAMTVPLVWRRRHPETVVATVVGVLVLRAALGGDSEQGSSFFPAVLLATFSVALYARRPEGAVAGGAFAVAGCVVALLLGFASVEGDEPELANTLIIAFFASSAWTAGWLLRKRVAQAHDAEARGDELAREAVADERARIARELHDVVAHSVSIISVQAGAAEQYVERDPAKAREHLGAVQSSARDALTEMRRLTGVLREEQAAYEPQPGLGRLDDLVEQARAGGLDAALVERGERPELPPGVDLAAFRIAQEALTNARKHAGRVAATVTVSYADGEIELAVVNAAGAAAAARNGAGGHGLVGMRERVRLYGGELETGPTADGGYRVRARLPLEAER